MTHRTPHVALFLESLEGGGLERMMLNLARGLSEYGLSVDLVLAKATGPYLADLPSSVNLVDLEASRVLYSISKLVNYLKTYRPQVLLSSAVHVNIMAATAAKIARSGTVVLFREASTLSVQMDALQGFKANITKAVMPLVYGWADAYVAVSRGVADDMIRFLNLPREKVHVVYNPVVTDDIFSMAQEPVNHPWINSEGHAVILAAGSLTPQKDYDTLLRAFSILCRIRPAKLIILGKGQLLEKLNHCCHELNIDQDVDFPGFVENPFAYMKRASLFVTSSLREGLPGALIQAMACGCPVVSTDCPSGPAEVLDNGRYGDLVPVQDPEALAAAMHKTLKQPPNTDRLIERAKHFCLKNAIRGYLDVCSAVGIHLYAITKNEGIRL